MRAVVDNQVIPAAAASMIDLLSAGEKSLNRLKDKIDSYKDRIALADVELLAPVPRPRKYFGVSLNYSDHVEETGLDKPEYPTFFNKQSTCVIGTGQAIHRPRVSEKLDYEGELGIVIGKRCRHVARAQAKSVIAGFTVCNDVSVRDWQIDRKSVV